MDARPGTAAPPAPRMLLRFVSNDARDAIQRSAHRGFPSSTSIISSADADAATAGFLQIFVCEWQAETNDGL
jgi:hypothetical protein